MKPTSGDADDRDLRLEQVLAQCRRADEAGTPLDEQALLREHPDLADELQVFFRGRPAMAKLDSPRQAAAPSEEATLAMPSPPEPAAGDRLHYFGDYELIEEIARGGMGVVYKARQVSLKRVVALKMILSGQLATPADVQRFRQEAEAAGNLDHPNIVPIHEIGEHQGLHYFSMGLVDGTSLSARVAAGPLAPYPAAELVETVARAVQYAHDQGVIHRDLKPANILLDRQGRPRVTDFGLAKRSSSQSGLTVAGQVLGTPSYMPPEQAAGKLDLVGPAADVYSLGAILYTLLAGRPPFQAYNSIDTLRQVLECEPVALRALDAAIPRDLETIVLKCLEKAIPRRYGSAREVADELHRFGEGRPILARPVGRVERGWRWAKRNPLVAGLTSAITILLVVAAIVSTVSAIVLEERRQQAVDAGNREKQARQMAETQRTRAEHETERALKHLYLAKMNLAQKAWEEPSLARLQELLEQTRPEHMGGKDLRGWEWHYWNRLMHRSLADLPIHDRHVASLALSADGKHLATASPDGKVTLRDAISGDLIREFAGLEGGAHEVAFSEDGLLLAGGGKINKPAAGEWGAVVVWDVATGQEKARLETEGVIYTVAFTPDGKQIVSGGVDARVWDIQQRSVVQKFTGMMYGVTSVAVSPDGKHLALGTCDRWVRLHSLPDGKELRIWHAFDNWVTRVQFSPDGQRLAAGCLDHGVRVFEVASGRVLHTLRGHTDSVHDVDFSGDGARLATCSTDQTLKVWSVDEGQELYTIKAHRDGVAAVVFSGDDQRLAAGTLAGSLQFWPAENVQAPTTLKAGGTAGGIGVWGVSFSPTGQQLAASAGEGKGTFRGKFNIFNWPQGDVAHTIQAQSWVVSQVHFSPDGNRVVTIERILFFREKAGKVHVWDARSGRKLLTLEHPKMVYQAVFSPDGRWIATAGQDGSVRFFAAQTGEEQLVIDGRSGPLHDVVFSPDGQFVAAGGQDSAVRIWDAKSGQLMETLPSEGKSLHVLGLAFDPTARRLAAGTSDRAVHIWNLNSGTREHLLRGHNNQVYDVAFTTDGSRLVSSSADGAVKLWDTESGQEVLTLRGHKLDVPTVSFHPSGWLLATASFDTTVKVWDATPRDNESPLPRARIPFDLRRALETRRAAAVPP